MFSGWNLRHWCMQPWMCTPLMLVQVFEFNRNKKETNAVNHLKLLQIWYLHMEGTCAARQVEDMWCVRSSRRCDIVCTLEECWTSQPDNRNVPRWAAWGPRKEKGEAMARMTAKPSEDIHQVYVIDMIIWAIQSKPLIKTEEKLWKKLYFRRNSQLNHNQSIIEDK